MNKGLTDYEIFKVVRPIFDEFNLDEFDMPVMHKVEESSLDLPNINPTNLQNLKKGNNNNNVIKLSTDDHWQSLQKTLKPGMEQSFNQIVIPGLFF